MAYSDRGRDGEGKETKEYQQAGIYSYKRERLVNKQWHIATGEGTGRARRPKSTSRQEYTKGRGQSIIRDVWLLAGGGGSGVVGPSF